MKLGIGLITSGGYAQAIPTPFVDSLYALHSELLRSRFAGIDEVLRIQSGKFQVDCARNEVVREALKEGCHALLFLDVDHVFSPEPIRRLFAADKDIITARYHVRKPPYHPCLYMRPLVEHVDGDFRTIHYGKGLFEVDRCGAGALLIRRHVLEQIGDPWFRFTREPHPPHDMAVTEDFYFCQRAHEEGFRIWVDWDAEVGHLATIPVTEDLHRAYVAIVEQKIQEGDTALVDQLVACGFGDEGYRLPSGQVVSTYRTQHAVA